MKLLMVGNTAENGRGRMRALRTYLEKKYKSLPSLMFGLMLLWSAGAGYAQSVPTTGYTSKNKFLEQSGDAVIVEIRYGGLKETRPEVLKQWVPNRPGDKISAFKENEIRRDLENLRIFSQVDFYYRKVEPGKALVEIKVVEKWTLYPVPVFLYHKDTQLGGLFLVESNFRGTNDGWVLGGIGSNRGWQYLAGYKNINVFYTPFFFWFRSVGGSIYVENTTLGGDRLEDYQLERYDGQWMIGYKFFNRLSVANTFGFRYGRLPEEDNRDKVNPPTVEGETFNEGIRITWDDTRYRFYYDEGLWSQQEYEYGIPAGGDGLSLSNFTSRNRYTAAVWADHTITLAVNFAISSIPEIFEHRLGGTVGSRTLPAFLIPADKYANGSFNYQIPLYNFDAGTLTTVLFYDGGVFQRNDEPTKSYNGPGFGLRFYIKDISIPAVGLDLGYQLETQTTHFSLFLGYSSEL